MCSAIASSNRSSMTYHHRPSCLALVAEEEEEAVGEAYWSNNALALGGRIIV